MDGDYNNGRQFYPAPNRFSSHAHIVARFYDPWGPGDGYDAYGYDSRQRMLVNSYPSRSTATQEYFTDEDYRIGEEEEFLFPTDANKFTYNDGFHRIYDGYGHDGYVLSEWNSEENISANSLQCGARFTSDEINTPLV